MTSSTVADASYGSARGHRAGPNWSRSILPARVPADRLFDHAAACSVSIRNTYATIVPDRDLAHLHEALHVPERAQLRGDVREPVVGDLRVHVGAVRRAVDLAGAVGVEHRPRARRDLRRRDRRGGSRCSGRGLGRGPAGGVSAPSVGSASPARSTPARRRRTIIARPFHPQTAEPPAFTEGSSFRARACGYGCVMLTGTTNLSKSSALM